MGDRQQIFSGTDAVRERHRFDVARLEDWMRVHVDGFRERLTVAQFKGGQSNPTCLVEAGGTRHVVRRKPPGRLLPSAHAVRAPGHGLPGAAHLWPLHRRQRDRHPASG